MDLFLAAGLTANRNTVHKQRYPFAALIRNAISNAGDTLFPAIAPNSLATGYSEISALIVG